MTNGATVAVPDALSEASQGISEVPSIPIEAPVHTERHVKIICIGAGASGLVFAYKLQRSFENFSFTIYEKNEEISGTWYENKYPGCACDIPAHNYTWSFEPKVDWSGVYATAREIFTYFKDFTRKYELGRYLKTRHAVCGAQWDDASGKWLVQITNLATGETIQDSCDFLINASGILNNWRWPAIPGLKNYKGPMLHSANWDDKVELAGKHVGLIGNGSSGIQILPAIQKTVSKLTTFIREPAYVSPSPGLEGHTYTEEELLAFRENQEHLSEYRKSIESGMNAVWALFLKRTQLQNESREYTLKQMKLKLQNEYLESKLIPNWSLGCRRLTPGVNYLETLGADNVKVVYGEILSITEKGCVCDDGKEYPVDVLICATGFDTSFKPRFPLIGAGGRSLADDWAEEAKGYFGLAAPGYPNYFMFLGPNCPIGNGPVLIAIEAQADYMLKMVDRWQTENIHSFNPTMAAVDDFIAYKDLFMKRTVWDEECRSWYKNNSASGKVAALWPGSSLHYMETIKEVRYDDWEVKYKGNRFNYFGNGYSQTQVDPTADWAFYIRNQDDSPFLSKSKRRKVETGSGTRTNMTNGTANSAAPIPLCDRMA